SGAEGQVPTARAGEDDVAAALTRKLQAGDGAGVGPSPRLHVLFAVERSRPRSLEEDLGQLGFGVQPHPVAKEHQAGDGERTDEDEALLHDQLRTAITAAMATSTIPINISSGAGVAGVGNDPSLPPQPRGRFTGTARVSHVCWGAPLGV